MFRVHDVMTGYDGLHLSGLPFYSDRALVLPGTAVIYDGDILGHLAYLRDVGVGAERVIRMGGTNLVRALHRHEEAVDALRRHVKAGGSLQFFSPTRHEHELMERLDISWDRAYNPTAELAEETNSKSALRRLGAALGMRDAFPEHRIIARCDPETVRDAVREIAGRPCDFVVLKRPDLASGDGMVLVPLEDGADPLIGQYVARHAGHEVIAEAGWHHVPMSVQWEIDEDGARFVCASAQLIQAMFEHRGNIIGSGALPGVAEEDIAEMVRICRPFAVSYLERGYRGVCGFDFMRTTQGRIYLLECNGRVTATTYAFGIGRQVRERIGDWAAAIAKVHVGAEHCSVADLHRGLGPLLFDGERGALPFNVRLLASERPQCAVCCIAQDADAAATMLKDVCGRFGGP